MSLMPHHARFFLNAWTSGYEDFLIAVSRHFKWPVHLDRWKYALYKSYLPNEVLSQHFTLDPTATRFHACQKQVSFSRLPRCIRLTSDVSSSVMLSGTMDEAAMHSVNRTSTKFIDLCFAKPALCRKAS